MALRIAFFVLLTALAGCSPKALVIAPEQAAVHLGEAVTVEGKVLAVNDSKKGSIFLNFGGRFPNQIFTGYVPVGAGLVLSDLKSTEGKVVRISGIITTYKGKPEIIVDRRSQITP